MNNVSLLGRIVRDFDLKYANTKNSFAITKFCIAVQRSTKAKDGEPNADFINCAVYGKPAETIHKFFKKGDLIIVHGHISTGSYTNKDGNKVYTTEVVTDKFEFVPRVRDNADGGDTSLPSTSFMDAMASARASASDGNANNTDSDGFMNFVDGLGGELPFA